LSETPKNDLPVAFKSPEEFRQVMRYLSARMGYINRVAAGEQKFLVEVSQMLTNLGKAFEEGYSDHDLKRKFGDGWTKGTASKAEQREILAEMILPKDRFRD
jgi:hypothetical protein